MIKGVRLRPKGYKILLEILVLGTYHRVDEIGYKFGKIFYTIIFEGNETKSYKLESGKDCSNNTLKSILSTLESYCRILNNDFVRS